MTWRLPDLPLPQGTSAADYPIPDRLNVVLSLAGWAAAVGVLVVGSRQADWRWVLLAGIAFSYAMLFVYSLIHQAQHDTLHASPHANYALGVLLSTLFPAPFTMIRTTHQGHHLRNRTDHELFDLYYPTDNRFLKTAQFYCILLGLFWPIVPIGGLLAAISPRIFRLPAFQRGRNTGYLLGDIRAGQTAAIRFEMLLIVLFFALLVWSGARPLSLLLVYACFSFNWSTRQYVSHAFTRRDVLDGALNLRTGRVMSWLLLNGEWDLNHHRYPMVPWPYLPQLPSPGIERAGYLRQYAVQWLGPRLCTEPAPESLQPIQLTLWQDLTAEREDAETPRRRDGATPSPERLNADPNREGRTREGRTRTSERRYEWRRTKPRRTKPNARMPIRMAKDEAEKDEPERPNARTPERRTPERR